MEATYCACLIANLEGLKSAPLPAEPFLAPTLSALDLRTQKLEASSRALLAPPPSTPPTWTSLAWRVARVAAAHTQRRDVALEPAAEAPLPPSGELLEKIVARINGRSPGTVIGKEASVLDGVVVCEDKALDDERTVCGDKDVYDEKRLNVVRQSLCHALGRNNRKVVDIPYDLSATCRLAMRLALELEKDLPFDMWLRRGTVPGPPRPGMGIGMGPRITNVHKHRHYVCRCHRKRGRSFGSRVGGFFGRLAWWRKKDDGSDSDSESSCCATESSSGSSIIDH